MPPGHGRETRSAHWVGRGAIRVGRRRLSGHAASRLWPAVSRTHARENTSLLRLAGAAAAGGRPSRPSQGLRAGSPAPRR